ncbi:MAG: hypothetical protein AAF772_21365 [Acidobacteriota bacterium]
MSRLWRAGARFGWALSMTGVSAVGRRLSGRDDAFDHAGRSVQRALAVDAVPDPPPTAPRAWPAPEDWFASDASRAAWQRAERGLVDGATELLASARAVLPTAGAPARAVCAWEQKLMAYGTFRRAATIAPARPFAERLAIACKAPVAERLWLIEGLGYDHVTRGDDLPIGDHPAAALPTLHTGAGLARARRRLHDDLDASALARATLDDARRTPRPDLGEIRVETLGFAVRLLAPDRIATLEDALGAAVRIGAPAPEASAALTLPVARALLWHGIGRAAYFARDRAVTPEALRRLAAASATPKAAAANAVAGLAWAAAMVHLLAPSPAPQVIDDALRAWRVAPADHAAIADGVASASLLWLQGVGETAAYRALADPRGRRWRTLVSEPVAHARAQHRDDALARPGTLYRFAGRGGAP